MVYHGHVSMTQLDNRVLPTVPLDRLMGGMERGVFGELYRRCLVENKAKRLC